MFPTRLWLNHALERSVRALSKRAAGALAAPRAARSTRTLDATTMKPQRSWTILVAVPLMIAARPQSASFNDCLTTTPAGQIFGTPFPSSDRWYGSESLAVMLPKDGIWRGMGPEHHYRDKLFWWSYGFKPGGESNLEVSARHLSENSLAAGISAPTNAHAPSPGGWTMLVAVEFPAAGCWEITGDYLGQKLSFVIEVRAETVSADAPPN